MSRCANCGGEFDHWWLAEVTIAVNGALVHRSSYCGTCAPELVDALRACLPASATQPVPPAVPPEADGDLPALGDVADQQAENA